MRPRIVAGNWKLNGSRSFARELLDAVVAAPRAPGVELVVMPPVPYLGELARQYGESGLAFGAQDLGVNEQGAYTGEVSAAMLAEFGCRYAIVGHSERRAMARRAPWRRAPSRRSSRTRQWGVPTCGSQGKWAGEAR